MTMKEAFERGVRSRSGRWFRIDHLSRAYNLTFNQSKASQQVMKDLGDFCHGWDTTFDKDPHISSRLQGRREVFLRIMNHLHMPEEKLMALYLNRPINDEENQ